jgi:hypothetical protein
MINSLWLIEGAPWPARKKYPAHNEAVRAFEAELGIVKGEQADEQACHNAQG